MVEGCAERRERGDEDPDGGFAGRPDGEVDAVPGGVLGFGDGTELDGFEDGTDSGTGRRKS
jgi:hypothetical protein